MFCLCHRYKYILKNDTLLLFMLYLLGCLYHDPVPIFYLLDFLHSCWHPFCTLCNWKLLDFTKKWEWKVFIWQTGFIGLPQPVFLVKRFDIIEMTYWSLILSWGLADSSREKLPLGNRSKKKTLLLLLFLA